MTSLQTRILSICSLIIILSGLVMGWIMYRGSEMMVANTVGQQALGIVERTLPVIDIEKYQEITPENGESEYYKELRLKLNEIREMNGMKYLYTMSRREKGDSFEYYYLVDGLPFEEEDASALGEVEEVIYPNLIKAMDMGEPQVGDITVDEYGTLVSAYVPIKNHAGEVIGIIGGDFNVESVYLQLQQEKTVILLYSAGILLISLVLLWFFARYLIQPLKQLTTQVEFVKNGDFTVKIDTDRKDEVGVLASAFEQMIRQLSMMIQAIRTNSHTLLDASKQLSKLAEETRSSSREVTATIQEISASMEVENLGVSNMAHTIEGMADSLQGMATNTHRVSEASEQTAKEAQSGSLSIDGSIQQMGMISQSVQESFHSIRMLQDRSQEIEKIVEVIGSIASQTNLLALNAAIEAARAGEHGRGFAVVADEVRKLAEQSEQSAIQIQQIIRMILEETKQSALSMNRVVEEVQTGSVKVEEAGQAFQRILQATDQVAEQVKEVSMATTSMNLSAKEVSFSAQQLAGMSEVATGKNRHIVSITEHQRTAMEKITQSSTQLSKMAEQLEGLVSRFKI